VYLHGLGYATIRSGVILSVATAAYLLIQPLAGMLADRYDTRITVIAGLLLAAASITATTFASGPILIGLVIAAGIGVGAVWTNGDALVSASAPPDKLGASIGAAQSFKEFGDMVGPLAVGVVTQFYGVRAGFVVCGVGAGLLVFVLTRSASLSHGSRNPGVVEPKKVTESLK
jgi:DHA1 family tetracycline resistance protein-like MFS transporter